MSKDVTFESEKAEKREKLLKILLPAAIVVGIVLIALAIVLIVRSSRRKFTGGEEGNYPYTWTEKEGTVTLTIDRAAKPDYAWVSRISDVEDDTAVLTVTADQKQPKNASSFTLEAKNPGRMSIDFLLQDPEGETHIAELNLLVEVTADEDGKLSASVMNTLPEERIDKIVSTENELFPYEVFMDDDGFVLIKVKDMGLQDYLDYLASLPADDPDEPVEYDSEGYPIRPEPGPYDELILSDFDDWECVTTDPSVIENLGILNDGSEYIVYLRPLEPGSCEVFFQSAYAGQQIYLSCSVNEEGRIEILSHNIRAIASEPASEESSTTE